MKENESGNRIRDINFGAVIVASPIDETLMAGGVILLHPEARWSVVSLCGREKRGIAEKYVRALERLGAWGQMGGFTEDEDSLPTQFKLQNNIMALLQSERFDVIITHSLWGEYRSNGMVELISKTVLSLIKTGRLKAKQVWQFAYEGEQEDYVMKPAIEADICMDLTDEIRKQKYSILTEIYGIDLKSVPRQESFWLLGKKRGVGKYEG